jgi:hypothetical protein
MNAMREWALVESAQWIRSVRNDGVVEDTFKDREEIEHAQRELGRVAHDLLKLAGIRACRLCGCSEEDACDGGCSWAGPELCSACDAKDKLLVRALSRPPAKQRARRTNGR